MSAQVFSPASTPTRSWSDELKAAQQAEKARNRGAALVHYRDALQRADTDPEAFAEIARHIARACERNPKDAGLRHLLGSALLFRRDFASAESSLRQASALAPTSAPILVTLGDSLMQAGKTAEAREV